MMGRDGPGRLTEDAPLHPPIEGRITRDDPAFAGKGLPPDTSPQISESAGRAIESAMVSFMQNITLQMGNLLAVVSGVMADTVAREAEKHAGRSDDGPECSGPSDRAEP